MADWYGEAFRRLLRRAERRSEAATARGLRSLKTLASRSRALLVFVTCCDHRFVLRLAPCFFMPFLPTQVRHGRKDHAGAEPASQARQMLELNEQGVSADAGVDSCVGREYPVRLGPRPKNDWRRGDGAPQPGAAGGQS